MRPLGERFEVIYGLAGLDLDDAHQFPAPLERKENHIREDRLSACGDRGVLLVARIDKSVELAFKLRLQLADYAVVLELLSHRPHQNRTHRMPPSGWISTWIKTRKSNMKASTSAECKNAKEARNRPVRLQ